ncbi:S8 family serine peptidase [Catenuloplanes sp. NPDC051500]|uniref:S8 family serine peptidase n=1 Tax=Catenuloplanes sp. NPDC051500 TaxID=3363959 RepID=UPI00379C0F06
MTVMCAMVLPVGPAAAAAESRYVKYIEVTAPVTLADLAGRLLSDPERADDLLHLNAGRAQVDGGLITGGAQPLTAGWVVVLPWDAYGDGVRYGLLPGTPGAPAPGTVTPGPRDENCTAAVSSGGGDPGWADRRLAADEAWDRSKGGGVLVAVVDSGVDGEVAQLSGRVALGADVTDGTARGDTDCLGSGTGMASVIAARADGASTVAGIAPEAMILPVRVVGKEPKADQEHVAAGVQVAVSAGAGVIALGSYVDTADPRVSAAVDDAIARGVVVVAPAAALHGATEAPTPPRTRPGLLRVGGVGPDEQPAADYVPGGVDVIAPGIDVPTLGIDSSGPRAGSGTQYAVAYVAGTAALVRSALPNLTAAQVTHRIGSTASPGAQAAPTEAHGYGMINPRAAVKVTLAEENTPVTSSPSSDELAPFRNAVIGVMITIVLAATGLLTWRLRQTPAGLDDSGNDAGFEDDGTDARGAAHDPDALTTAHDPDPLTAAHDPDALAAAHDPGALTTAHDPDALAAAHDPDATFASVTPGVYPDPGATFALTVPPEHLAFDLDLDPSVEPGEPVEVGSVPAPDSAPEDRAAPEAPGAAARPGAGG